MIRSAGEESTDWQTVITVGAYTGARLRDCCRLKWDDINLTEGTLTFTPMKTGAEMIVPLHRSLLGHLERRASAVGDKREVFVTPTLAVQETGGSGGLSMQFGQIMKRAGISTGKTAEGNRRKQNSKGFHSLRHSFVSALASFDVPRNSG